MYSWTVFWDKTDLGSIPSSGTYWQCDLGILLLYILNPDFLIHKNENDGSPL